jgi:hypothetical protein
LYSKVSFVRAAHTSLDVMDRYTLLHVGYRLTACGRWIIACCVDQRGEAYDLGVWLTQSPASAEQEGDAEVLSDEEYAVKRVWDFAMQFAKKANLEWRVVFTRLDVMTESELNGMFYVFALFQPRSYSLFSMDSTFLRTSRSISRTTTLASHSRLCCSRCTMVCYPTVNGSSGSSSATF